MARGLFRHPPQPTQRVLPQRSISTYDSVVRSNGPVSYWHLDETSGTTAIDSVGANNGTYGGGVAPPTLGVATLINSANGGGTAVQWDGNVSFSEVSVDAVGTLFSGTASWSIEVWVNQTTDASFPYLFSATTSAPILSAYLTSSNLGLVLGRTDAGNLNDECVAAAISSGATHHVVGTYDGSNLRLYVDGTLTGGPTASTRTAATATVAAIGNLTTQTTPINGTLDEVAVYNYALSAAAALAHYNVGVPAAGAKSATASDSLTVGDSVARQLTLFRTASDAITVDNVVSHAGSTFLRTASDALTIANSVARVVTNNRTASDALTVANAVTRTLTNLRTESDALTVGDSNARTVTNLRTAADSVTIAESVAGIKVVPRTAADAITVGDSVARQLTLFRTASDSVGTSESNARTVTNLRTTSDGLTVGNTVARVVSLFRTAADSISVGDSVARVVTNLRTASDAVSVGDSVARVLTLFRTASDSVTISESVVGDVTHGGTTVPRTAADSLAVSESNTRQVTNLRTTADSVAIADSNARTVSLNRTAADGLTISESVAGSVTHGGQTVNVTAADALTVSDAATRTLTNNRTAADSIATTDAVVQAITSFGTASDSISVGNAAVRVVSNNRTAADSVTITDSVSATINGVPIVPAGAGHKGPVFVGVLREPKPRRREERIRVPLALSMDARDTLRIGTSVSAVVEFNDDEDALALLVLAGAL